MVLKNLIFVFNNYPNNLFVICCFIVYYNLSEFSTQGKRNC
jgi:hypothetical protein